MSDKAHGHEFSEAHKNRPPRPVSDKAVEIAIVGTRCVYINDYRVAGGKPYYSENLPYREMTTSLGEVINAFREEDIIEALSERRREREYFAAQARISREKEHPL